MQNRLAGNASRIPMLHFYGKIPFWGYLSFVSRPSAEGWRMSWWLMADGWGPPIMEGNILCLKSTVWWWEVPKQTFDSLYADCALLVISPIQMASGQLLFASLLTINCGKFWKRWEYQTTWPASWETYMQVRKQQLELDMDQQTGSK